MIFPVPFVRGGILACLLAGLGSLYQATGQVVHLVVEGEPLEIRTHASNVEGALRQLAAIQPLDRVSPDPADPIVTGMTIRWERSSLVKVETETGERVTEVAEPWPLDVLRSADVMTFPADRVWADGIPVFSPQGPSILRPERVRVQARQSFAVSLDGLDFSVWSAASSWGEALWDAGIRVREGDRPSESLGEPVGRSARRHLGLARPVILEAEGEERTAWVSAETTGEALAAAGLALLGLDYSVPSSTSPLPSNGRVRVVRVAEQVETYLEPLPFESTFEGDPELEIDLQRLIAPGSLGVAATTTRVRYEDGIEVSRIQEGRRIAREPEPRVIGFGTMIVPRTLETPDGPLQYYRAVSMYATAYSPCHLGVPNYCSTITSSGKELAKGMVAVLLRWYRVMKGQSVYIAGYGIATIEDVGGGIPGRHWIDLGYTDAEIISWNRWVTVYFLMPAPPADRIYWILD